MNVLYVYYDRHKLNEIKDEFDGFQKKSCEAFDEAKAKLLARKVL